MTLEHLTKLLFIYPVHSEYEFKKSKIWHHETESLLQENKSSHAGELQTDCWIFSFMVHCWRMLHSQLYHKNLEQYMGTMHAKSVAINCLQEPVLFLKIIYHTVKMEYLVPSLQWDIVMLMKLKTLLIFMFALTLNFSSVCVCQFYICVCAYVCVCVHPSKQWKCKNPLCQFHVSVLCDFWTENQEQFHHYYHQ